MTGTNIEDANIPTTFGLNQNFPNPFNPSTTISYQLPSASRVSLKIYNVLGQEVRTLFNEQQSAGFRSSVWNGKNASGSAVASGVYFCRLEAERLVGHGSFTAVRKMMLVK